jgi:sulfur-carrier protein
MPVRVRLFAALRDAAGTAEDSVPAGALPHLLDTLCERHGATFRARLAISSVLIDGQPVPRGADVAVEDGSELALLPPVSGGAPA